MVNYLSTDTTMIIYPTKSVKIINKANPSFQIKSKVCNDFYSSFRGFMFTRAIDDFFGLLFINKQESRIDTSIHMLFMNFDLTVLWLDRSFKIIDKVLARKWRLAYIPSRPAQYVLEIHPNRYQDFSIGDCLEIINEP